MKIKVIGKREGISKKSGKPYLQVSYLAPMIVGVGEAGDSLFLDPTEHKFDSILVGKMYDAEFSRTGFLVGFTPVQ